MNHKLAISTISLGWHSSHKLERKLAAAASAGFQGVEIFITDLDKYATTHNLTRIETAVQIKQHCSRNNLEIVCLGSFDNFEGDPSRSLEERLELAREWIAIAHELGTTVIQIPSNDAKDAIGDIDTIVSDFQALSDIGLPADPPISFAYEALGWGTHVADWEESLRIVELVNRPNFGLCLDTYHVLARLWADPRAPSGGRPGGDAALRASLETFLRRCKEPEVREKIIYVQLSDAEKMVPPILPGHEVYSEEKDGTHSWCTYGRIFPLEVERGAYLPMEDILKTWLVSSGWSGWVSMEVFHRDMKKEENGPEEWARRGKTSWDRIESTTLAEYLRKHHSGLQ
ncbi:hypothetical protein H2200_001020 [Cladophialophora chaetospira]|uniref:Xylose isomerase-like TIM barrel domain-containing protein n=1 Tax=Cladophialophora chaetospira TaxID=386627 RepID=A0AA38XPN3_9EURO|nr:hypothetical protein H2200_001020 [Cladophialophora chaetospira]